MVNVEFISNKSNIKKNEALYKDIDLNNLVNIFIENPSYLQMLGYVKSMFYVTDSENYDELVNLGRIRYKEFSLVFEKIISIFNNWKVLMFKKKLGKYRGGFLELLTNKYLLNTYSDYTIYNETKLKIDNYISYTPEFIVDLYNKYTVVECKFSVLNLYRKHIDQLISIKNKLSNVDLYLISLDNKNFVSNKICELKGDTNEEKYSNIINNINFICFEDLIKGNPFI